MRFDLEINKVGSLTSYGLEALANMFYDEAKGNVIKPAKWDSIALVEQANNNVGSIPVSKYNKLQLVHPSAFRTGVGATDSLKIVSLLNSRSYLCPLFQGGNIVFNKASFNWDMGTVTKECMADGLTSLLATDIDADTDESSISVCTYKYHTDGTFSELRRYTYIPYSSMNILRMSKGELPAFANINTLYICEDTQEIHEVSKSTNQSVKILDIKAFTDNVESLTDNGDCIVTSYNDILIKKNGLIEDVAISRIFRTSKSDYKFTVKNNKVITNTISSEHIASLGTIPALSSAIAPLPEFPCQIISTSEDLNNSVVTSNMNTALLIRNNSASNIDMTIVYRPKPLVSYRQVEKQTREDVVYKNINLAPHAVGFRRGAICAFNSMMPTVNSKDGGFILAPALIELSTVSSIDMLSSAKATARLTTDSGIGVKGAKVKFEFETANDGVKWIGSDSNDIEVLTNMSGIANASFILSQSKFGWYIDKRWAINATTLRIPFNIKTSDPNDICLFVITADDPITGTIENEDLNHLDISDYYLEDGKLDSYYINGRKIAHVDLALENGILRSSFIKPASVVRGAAPPSTDVWVKNAFIKGKESTMINAESSQFDILQPYDAVNGDTTGWDLSTQPANMPTWYKAQPSEITTITFSNPLPSTKVIGYYLIIKGIGLNTIKVRASYVNEDYGISLVDESDTININDIIKSEHEMVYSDRFIEGENTSYGVPSYLSISEAITNPFGRDCFSYGCIYSDPTYTGENKCMYNSEEVQRNFTPTPDGKTCRLTPEYYDSIGVTDKTQWCPKMDARYISPLLSISE